jgi:hypothetical protein
MYRDSTVERRARAIARYRETVERADAALRLHYGAAARLALREALVLLKNASTSADHATAAEAGELEEIERALDSIDERIIACTEQAAQMAEVAAPYVRLGAPSSSAERLARIGHFQNPPHWSPSVAEPLRGALDRWQRHIRGEVIVAGEAEGVAIFFHEHGHPFRLEIDARLIAGREEEGYVVSATLVGPAPQTSSPISIRPQTFGDDVRAALRIRRDLTFDDPAFDPLYFVSGDEMALRDFFTPHVRAAFVKFAERQVTTMEVSNEVAMMPLETDDLAGACAFFTRLLRDP